MRVGLFIPCHVDQLWPEVGLAAQALLERAGVEVEFPPAQTCCGQALLSAGGHAEARAPSRGASFASSTATTRSSRRPRAARPCCAFTIRRCSAAARPSRWPRAATSCASSCSACCGCRAPSHAFPHRVALHAGCHALRELRLGRASEGGPGGEDPVRALLSGLAGIELVPLARADECCGFGGVFSVVEEAISCRMGLDRLDDQRAARAEVVTSSDPSCLLHLSALARRHGRDLRVLHVAQILAGEPSDVSHAERATEFLRDAERARWHDASLWSLRVKRDRAAAAVPDWEALREAADALKRHTLAELPFYLTQFEARARAHGAVVHWARDAAEHSAIVEGLLREAGARRVVKSKSMLTEECGLNPHLEARGIEIVDTDLGERIVQLRHERAEPHRDARHPPAAPGDRRALPRRARQRRPVSTTRPR